MGVDALKLLGFRSYQALRSARKFRIHDEDALRELVDMRHDQKRYLSRARERIRILEELLLAEHQVDRQERDAGWDIETLREDLASRE